MKLNKPQPKVKLTQHQMHAHTHHRLNWFYWIKNTIILSLAFYFIALSIIQPTGAIKYTWHYGIWFPLATYIIFWEGRGYFKIYLKLKHKIMDMDTLIGLGGHIIYLYSTTIMFLNLTSPMYSYNVVWEAPIILFTITNIGHSIEDSLTNSTIKTYKQLQAMKNSVAFLLQDKKIIKTQANAIKIGQIIIVKKGDLVPLDGTLLEPMASFNYANITGESKSITLKHKQEVLSGAFNLGDAVKILVTKDVHNSTIGQIVEKIEDATMSRPKIQKVADKALKWFIPTVLGISFLTFLIWLILGFVLKNGVDLPWLNRTNNPSIWGQAITAGVTVLAIACPCALGIATPLIVTVTSTLMIKSNMLANQPNALEEINQLKYFAFDKTGTITNEQLKVLATHGEKKWISVAKALEAKIKHPIAQAICSLPGPVASIQNIKTSNHLGVKGLYLNQPVTIKGLAAKDAHKYNQTQTLIGLYVQQKLVLVFELGNEIKPMVKETITKLKQRNLIPVMITGDAKGVAMDVAQRIGIEQVYYEVTPTQKVTIIQNLAQKGEVAFVGDGFNDSIAMKKANLSIAFASGSDITNSLADISLLNKSFTNITNLIMIAKMNKNRIRLSMTWALLFNIITIPIAIIALVPPWAGATIMASSDILVVTTALLYRIKGSKKLIKT